MWKVDPVTGAAILTSRAIDDIAGVAFGEDAVWVTSFSRTSLVRLNPETGDVEARIAIGGPSEDVAVHGGLGSGRGARRPRGRAIREALFP